MRFGVIGCGNIARRTVIPLLAKGDKAKLMAVASRSEKKANEVANLYANCEPIVGYDPLLAREDIDAVYIALPIGLHAEWCIKAAKAKKHIICEKTLTKTLEETLEVVKECRENDVALLEGFAYQFHTQHQSVKDFIKKGEIGEPILFQAAFGFPPIKSKIRYDEALGGGALLDAGTYTIHAARHFFGFEPVTLHSILENDSYEVDIHGAVQLHFTGKQSAQLSFGFNNMYRNYYSIWGTEGIITVHRVFSTPPHYNPTIVIERQGLKKEVNLPACDHFKEEIRTFSEFYTNQQYKEKWYQDAMQQAIIIKKIKYNE